MQTTAAVSALVIGQQTTDLVALVKTYAIGPSLVTAVAAGASGDAQVEVNLTNLAQADPGISATFVASLQGTSLDTYPLEPSVIGTNFKYRDWYTGLIASGRPFVSNAIVTKEAGHGLAVTVTDYIRGSNGRPIGILGVNYSLAAIRLYSANVGRAQHITLTVTDRVGTSLTAGGGHGLVSLASDPRVEAARAGRSGLLDYAPVLPGGGRGPIQLSSYTPIAGTGWTVIASIPERVAFAGLARLRDTVLAITALLVLVLLAGVRVMASSDRRRRDSELQVQRRDRELARVLESTDEGFLSIDVTGVITAWNARAEELYGWAAPDVLGKSLADTVIPPEHRDDYKEEIARYRAGSGSSVVGKRVEMTALHRDGHEIPVEVGLWAHDDGAGFSAFAHDITERVTGQARLSRQARIDQLTGLANRFALLEALNASFEGDTDDVLVFVDLDRFKIVNDSLGHETGDSVITETGRRLRRSSETEVLIARLGGDEFALIVRGPITDTEMATRCEAILDAIRQPYELTVAGAVTRSYLGVSLGVTCLAGHSVPADAMREADLALYRAKESGRDRFEVFSENIRHEALARLALETIIRSALDSGGFVPYLQPIVDLADGVILGHELLLCLTQDDGTEDLPPGLIEVAEESGLITEIDAVTLRTALELLGGPYSAAGMLNVKISARTIQHPGFADMIAKVGLEAGAARCRLGVELTEKVLLESEQIAARAIDLLHDVGFRVGLDQFGTGHYALVDLRRFKLDFIKIDRSFVAELASDEDAAPDMLKVFLDIGATFGFDVIAEGVDTPRQAGTLLVLGCRSGQGEDLGSILSVSEYMQKDGPVSPVNGEETFEVALVSGSDRRATLSSRR